MQLIQAQRDIEILHCLRRRAFEQIVQGGDDDDTFAARRNRESADFDMMTMRDAAHPWRIVDDSHERRADIERAISLLDRVFRHRSAEPEIHGHRDSAEMRRDMRKKFDWNSQMPRHFALVHMPDKRIRHKIVAQGFGIVAIRRRRSRAGVSGNTEANRRTGEFVFQRRNRQLHRRRVATGIADPALSVIAFGCQFRQPVVPGFVESMIGR